LRYQSPGLGPGQSFAIGGLLDKQLTETLEKIPLLGDIPLLGKLFHSRNINRQNTELLVIVTPELVQPILAGQHLAVLKFSKEFAARFRSSCKQDAGLHGIFHHHSALFQF